ncbi:MAG: IPT/TIG domain-containing protein [archaeon]|nr:IPT/TIG domain-containing protein [archaeon]
MNYDQNLRCSFGTRSVKATFVSSTQLICISPYSDVVNKRMPFAVTFNFQQKTKDDINYVYYETPQIFSLEPYRGPSR